MHGERDEVYDVHAAMAKNADYMVNPQMVMSTVVPFAGHFDIGFDNAAAKAILDAYESLEQAFPQVREPIIGQQMPMMPGQQMPMMPGRKLLEDQEQVYPIPIPIAESAAAHGKAGR